MANNNTIQKLLIKNLTQTHQNPANAFTRTIAQAQTQREAEQVAKIADALKIKL